MELHESSMFGCDEIVTLLVQTIAIKCVCSAYTEIIKALEQVKDDRSVRGPDQS